MKSNRFVTYCAFAGLALPAAGSAAANAAPAAARAPGSAFGDCAHCPEMVVIPAGRFMMGSGDAEKAWAATHGGNLASVADESPRHEVTVRAFALGRYDVTRAQYAAFVAATGRGPGDGCGPNGNQWIKTPGVDWEHPGFAQTGRDPVVCVSWQDAQAYVAWLNANARHAASSQGEGPYRLPSESEWEYAARAGTTTKFFWGDGDDEAAAHAWFKDNADARTHPVGAKPANAFGLHDMVGNVWQWTQDCYADSYAHAPADGSAAETDRACLRVDRGGSWYYPAWLLRPAARERNPADYRDVIMGFRVAKTLP